MDQEDLCIALKKAVDEYWKEEQAPIYLSALPTIFRNSFPDLDYRSALDSGSIKAFIKSTGEAHGYKIIEHPTQRAKVGVAPSDVTFEFPIEPASTSKFSREEALSLGKLLSKLPPNELEKISLPASLVVRLLNAR